MSWIKCSERMPEIRARVMVYVKPEVLVASFQPTARFPDRWLDDSDEFWATGEITHWQPLPEPPHE